MLEPTDLTNEIILFVQQYGQRNKIGFSMDVTFDKKVFIIQLPYYMEVWGDHYDPDLSIKHNGEYIDYLQDLSEKDHKKLLKAMKDSIYEIIAIYVEWKKLEWDNVINASTKESIEFYKERYEFYRDYFNKKNNEIF